MEKGRCVRVEWVMGKGGRKVVMIKGKGGKGDVIKGRRGKSQITRKYKKRKGRIKVEERKIGSLWNGKDNKGREDMNKGKGGVKVEGKGKGTVEWM